MINSEFLTESEKVLVRDLNASALNVLGHDVINSLDDLELEEGIPQFIKNIPKHDEDENYVGQLQELCQKNMWPPPTYTFNDGQNSNRSANEYYCKVSLWKWNQTSLRNDLYHYRYYRFRKFKKSCQTPRCLWYDRKYNQKQFNDTTRCIRSHGRRKFAISEF